MLNLQTYSSPLGELVLGSYNKHLVLCDFKDNKKIVQSIAKIQSHFGLEFIEANNLCICNAQSQLNEYFNQQRKNFSIDILMVGTEFQQKVWRQLTQTTYGKSISYKELSLELNHPTAIRAIATANGANPLAIVVPCHRIIGINGDLVGYSGGLDRKKKLLELEGAFFKNSLTLFD